MISNHSININQQKDKEKVQTCLPFQIFVKVRPYVLKTDARSTMLEEASWFQLTSLNVLPLQPIFEYCSYLVSVLLAMLQSKVFNIIGSLWLIEELVDYQMCHVLVEM